MTDEKKAFPTRAEAAAAIAELRRHSQSVDVACKIFNVPSVAALWPQLDAHNRLKCSGSAETRHIINKILGRVWLIDGADMMKIHGGDVSTVDNEVKYLKVEKDWFKAKEDWLAWVENLTADEYERFTSIGEKAGAELLLAGQARASAALAKRIKEPSNA